MHSVRRLSRVINRPVVDVENGRVLGKVSDVACDLESGKVVALLVDADQRAGGGAVLVGDVERVGADAVTVRGSAALKPLDDVPDVCQMARAKAGWRERKVVTLDGRDVGQVRDLMVTNDLRRVLQVEVSEGLVTDLVNGRKRFRIAGPGSLVVGTNAVVLRTVT